MESETITIPIKEYNSLLRYKIAHDKAMNSYVERKRQARKDAGTYRPRGRPRKGVGGGVVKNENEGSSEVV